MARFRRHAPWRSFTAGVGLTLVLSSAASCLLPEARLNERDDEREVIQTANGGATGSASAPAGTSGATATGRTNGGRNEAGAAAVLTGTPNTAGAGARPTERDAGQSPLDDVDGGGGCSGGACGVGEACIAAADCESRVCVMGGCAPGIARCCQAPSCSDGVANGSEPVVDCGNAACGLCAVGSSCEEGAQCASGFCQLGSCADPGTCTDNIRNGTETDTDCGGNSCPRCSDLTSCAQNSDCLNANCDASGTCISCGDNAANGTETDIDCGGGDPFCQRCAAGLRCLTDSDCASAFCAGGFCG